MSISGGKSSFRRSYQTTDFDDLSAVQTHQTSDFFIGKNSVDSAVPWRVFINHVDSYHGRYLVDFLSEQTYVNPRRDAAERSTDKDEVQATSADEDNEEEETRRVDEPTKKYQIVGTMLEPHKACAEDATTIIKDPSDREAFLNELMKCGIIIYDVTQEPSQVEEALWVLKAIQGELGKIEETRVRAAVKRSSEVRYLLLISSVMTWALTKPLSPEEPDLPFTEADYRKRKPHPHYQQHCNLEKELLVVRKNVSLAPKLKGLVISCGVTYGEEEGPLHHLFKMAWKNASHLPIIGRGSNLVPMLHVRDLVATVATVLRSWPRKLRYILAVEQELVPQRVIVKKISGAFTTGKVRRISAEDAARLPEISQQSLDMLAVNLNVEPMYLVDAIDWYYGIPFRENMERVAEEFRRARHLRPMRIIVLGPPAAGKTRVACYLCEHYGLHYVQVESLINDTIRKLTDEIEAAVRGSADKALENEGEEDVYDEDDEDEENSDDSPSVEELKQQLSELRRSLEKNGGRLDDEALSKLFLARLKSKECQNQGYVLDGYPKSFDQAKGLFGDDLATEEESDEGEDDGVPASSSINSTIMPELVVALEASDEFLRERVINRPEREIQNTHYTEEHMMRRLMEYRERNAEENTPLRFFDEIEVHPLVIPIENDVCPDMFPTIAECLEKLGNPRNYGLSPQEAAEAEARATEKARAAEEAERLRKESEFLESKRQREEKMMEWTNLMESLREEEEERLCILGEPLRHYLARYIFPTLTRALIEVAKLRPDDPIDYLAEYLFKENPEGKMFEPDHTRAMNILLDKIEKFKHEVITPEDLDDTVASFWSGEKRQEISRATVNESETSCLADQQEEKSSEKFEGGAEGCERQEALHQEFQEDEEVWRVQVLRVGQ